MITISRLTAIALAGMLAATAFGSTGVRADECTDELVKMGEKQYRKCKACHKLEDGKNGVGPHLYSVVGRGVGGVDGYKYSKAMAEFGADGDKVWDAALLDAYLTKPKKLVKGTKMAFAGIRKEKDRVALICYLEKNGG